MTTLILGLDGLDYKYVQEHDLLSDLNPQHLQQDFEGANALYTYRIWPCFFAGEVGGESEDEYADYHPDELKYIWEQIPSPVLLAPVEHPSFSKRTDEFPENYVESWRPRGRLKESLDRLESEVQEQMDAGNEVVVACTRTPDIVGHHYPDKAEEWIVKSCALAERLCEQADNYLVVSDHGFGEFGTKGIEAHTRDAVLASSFADYETMTALCEGWHDDLHEVVREQQLQALGYT